MCGVFFEGVGDWVGGRGGNKISFSPPPHPIPNTLKKHPTHLV